MNSNNLDYLDNCIDYFQIRKIIIAVDQDEPGQALQQELIRRLGAEICYVASFEDCKDANEYLLKYGSERLSKCIEQAKPVPLENVTTFKDIEGDVKDFVKTVSNRVTKSVYPILMQFLVRIPVSLSLLLVFLALVSQILSIKWW